MSINSILLGLNTLSNIRKYNKNNTTCYLKHIFYYF